MSSPSASNGEGPPREALAHYLDRADRSAPPPPGAFSGAAGGAPCGDLVRVSLVVRDGVIDRVTFGAEGCAMARAAAAAACELVHGLPVLEAARITSERIAEELGGLEPAAAHGAELAADAVHRAIGAAAGSDTDLVSAAHAGDESGPCRRERVLVALSGGVDSAVAALLERARGVEVVAVTLKLWEDPNNDGELSCCSPEAVLRARRLSHSLGIPHLTLNLTDEFGHGVVAPYVEGHRKGETPNPCVLCNGNVRLDAMIRLADRVGAAGLATGHYARVVDDGEGPLLTRPADSAKDQAYMLAGLDSRSLARLRFPLAELTKPQVRAMAEDAGLSVARRPESQDLCFLAGEGRRRFLRRHGGLGDRPGEIVSSNGSPLGRHSGHHDFTVGQRRGLGIAAGAPLYVLATDAARNQVVVGARSELRTRKINIRDAVLHRDATRVNRVRVRYHATPLECRVGARGRGVPAGIHERLSLELKAPADAAAPGQTAALMDGDLIIGHATIA